MVVAASGDGADFVNEEGGFFPRGEVAAAVRSVPVHDVGELALGLAAGWPRYFPGEALHPAGTVMTSWVALVNQSVTCAMLSQYSLAEEAPVPVSQYKEMSSST